MKKIILSAICLLPVGVMGQQAFTIKGDVKALKAGDKIYLVYGEGTQQKTDSAMVTNGTFEFKGTIKEPVKANFFLNKNPFVNRSAKDKVLDAKQFYIEPTTFKVEAADSLKNIKVIDSKVNDDNEKLNTALKPFTDKRKALGAEYAKLSPEQKKDKSVLGPLREKYEKIAEEMTPTYLNFAKSNPNSFISVGALSSLLNDQDALTEVDAVYAGLGAKVKETNAGKELAKKLEIAKKTAIGVLAMDFTQNDPDGKPVKLSDFKGKYVLIDFWASWCGPCRGENPNVVAAYNTYKDKNFTVLGVSLDKPGKKDVWLKAVKDDNLTWTQVSDLKGWNNEVAKAWGIRGIPANFLIDPNGKIVAKGLRGEELHKKLEGLIIGR